MSFSRKVVVVRDNTAEIIGTMRTRAAAIVKKTAFDIEAEAKERSRHDTGAMEGAWKARPESVLVWTVKNNVEYTVYHEFGTHKMSAQPMARPAAVAAFPDFVREMRNVLGGLG